MTGIILAAGGGTRLADSNVVRPKCLASFDGTTLLELQLRALRSCGIHDIAVVTGFEGERVRRACGSGVRFIDNTRYAGTNSIYSLWLARALLGEGFVVMNCDVLFHPAMLADLLTARYACALLVSYLDAGQPPFSEEEMKVSVTRGRVVAISKDLPASEVDGENVGIAKFGADGAKRLVTILDHIVASGGEREWAPRAFAEYAREAPLYAIGTRGLPWTEIDTPGDYAHAVDEVFPALKDTTSGLAPALRLAM